MPQAIIMAPLPKHAARHDCEVCQKVLGRRTRATHRLVNAAGERPPIRVCQRHGERMTAGANPPGLCSPCWSVGFRDTPAAYRWPGGSGLCAACRQSVLGCVLRDYGEHVEARADALICPA